MYSEFDLIDVIAKAFGDPDGVTIGIGDDAAVLDPGRFDLVSTDTLVEGVHFDLSWCSPQDVGWKLIAVNLSDIAAMGGAPGVFFLNFTIPTNASKELVDGLIEGLVDACTELVPEGFPVSVAGGDVTSTHGPLVLSATLMGESSPVGPVLRAGAVPGDRIVVLGPLGMSAAGLAYFQSLQGAAPTDYDALVSAYRRPIPRVHEGALLGLYGVPSALIDISDGLLQDLGHILRKSNVGATIETHNIPLHTQMGPLADALDADALAWALGGGEDFELLVTIPPARMPKLWELSRHHHWDVFDLGEVRAAQEGLTVLDAKGRPMDVSTMGFRHFS